MCVDGQHRSGVGHQYGPYSRFALDGKWESATAENRKDMDETTSPDGQRRDRQRPLRVLVSASERHEIERRATSACLSRSAYLRAAALSHPIKRLYDLEAVERLAAVSVDVRRLADVLAAAGAAQERAAGNPTYLDRVILETRDLLQRLLELAGRV